MNFCEIVFAVFRQVSCVNQLAEARFPQKTRGFRANKGMCARIDSVSQEGGQIIESENVYKI